MQTPIPASASGRRNLLAATAAMIAAPTALAAATGHDPDADLIATCRQAEALANAMNDMVMQADVDFDTPRGDDFRNLDSQQSGLIRDLLHMQARTIDGIAARARLLAVYNGDGGFSMDPTTDTDTGCLVIGLFRDVLLMNGLPIPPALAEELAA